MKCMVKYGEPVVNNYDVWFVANEVSNIKAKDVAGLQNSLSSLVDMLLLELYKGQSRRYAYGTQVYKNNQIVYMVMQCTDDIFNKDCTKCILHVSGKIKRCCSGAIAATSGGPRNFFKGCG
ncbi:putative Gnk2-like domain-containing protein [Helianthus anomalus]